MPLPGSRLHIADRLQPHLRQQVLDIGLNRGIEAVDQTFSRTSAQKPLWIRRGTLETPYVVAVRLASSPRLVNEAYVDAFKDTYDTILDPNTITGYVVNAVAANGLVLMAHARCRGRDVRLANIVDRIVSHSLLTPDILGLDMPHAETNIPEAAAQISIGSLPARDYFPNSADGMAELGIAEFTTEALRQATQQGHNGTTLTAVLRTIVGWDQQFRSYQSH